jgi:hypothetical protein
MFVSAKIFVLAKVFQKCSFSRKFSRKFFANNFHFRVSFLQFNVDFNACPLSMATVWFVLKLYGFDHPVGYLYTTITRMSHLFWNRARNGFVSPNYPIISHSFLIWFWTLLGSVGSKLHLPLGTRMFHGIFASRAIFGENFSEIFRYFRNFS